jgi:D-amino-acid dehydrogenase
MHVVVLGSGVIGTAVAYYLARDGHRVTVIDRQPGAALETSFGNAGEISPGLSAPWAGPGVPLKAIKWLLMAHGPLVVRQMLDPAMWRWGLALLANCTEPAYQRNKRRMVSIAEHSRDCLRALRADTGIGYDHRSLGTLQLFRTAAQLEGVERDAAVLRELGVPYEVLDRDGVARAEPALARAREKFAGGLRLPNDETGDCHLFTARLAELAVALGAEFRFNTRVEAIASEGNSVSAVRTSAGDVRGDAYVCALGSYAPQLLAPLGIRLPVYPVKGYSITVPIADPAGAPESTVMDETYKVALTRLGNRIRVGGTAELAGYDLTLRPGRRQTLEFVVRDLFPDGGDISAASFWTGLRPMTPDGTPVIGPTPCDKLYLAGGHGTLGWTMSAGTGQLLADLIAGRAPAISLEGLTLARYG